eukprot:scaffold215341_cov30-Tisochrysis_lutea.AAC.2
MVIGEVIWRVQETRDQVARRKVHQHDEMLKSFGGSKYLRLVQTMGHSCLLGRRPRERSPSSARKKGRQALVMGRDVGDLQRGGGGFPSP